MPASTSGWWRHNRLALPAMVLVLAALGWTVSERARDVWWGGAPHVAHEPSADGWATIDERDLRVVSFSEVTDPPPHEITGEPRERPGNTIWRAELESRASGDTKACPAELEDDSGRRFGGESPVVPSFSDETYAVECGGGDEPVSVLYFLLPDDAAPAAIRVTSPALNPDYWRLPVD